MWPMYIAMAVVMILMALYLYVFIKRICEIDIKLGEGVSLY